MLPKAPHVCTMQNGCQRKLQRQRCYALRMTPAQGWIALLILAVFGASLAAFWYGGHSASKAWRSLLLRADLPVACQQRIEATRKRLELEAEYGAGTGRF